MKHIGMLIAVFFVLTEICGQEIKNLYPSRVVPLDFSEKARAEWALRDSILDQIGSGEKKWADLSEEEFAVMERCPDVYADIWDIVGGGDSWYNMGGPYDVTASSFLESQGANTYVPKNAHDLDYKNAWVEGAPGYGIGEYLIYHFKAASPRITEIIIVNGYVKSLTAWKNNSRVKTLKMYINEEPYAILNVKDAIAGQVFEVPPIGNPPDTWGSVDNDPEWTMKFEILDVYKGLKYDDVAISEIYFDGLDVLCFAKGTQVLMADKSTKNIEDLCIGDVISFIDLRTGRIQTATIEKLGKVVHRDLVNYRFESGRQITATQDHPFRIEDKGWASLKPDRSKQYKGFETIGIISIGDFFVTDKGTDKLIAIESVDRAQETYTISKTSSGDNFIANGLIAGVEELNE